MRLIACSCNKFNKDQSEFEGNIMKTNEAFKIVKKQIDDKKAYILNNIDNFMLDDYEQISCFLDDISCIDEYDICVDLAAAYREDTARNIIDEIDRLRDIAAEEAGSFEAIYQESGADDEKTDAGSYIVFVKHLRKLKGLGEDSVNIWHVEQNNTQTLAAGKKSCRQLCFNAYFSIIECGMDVL